MGMASLSDKGAITMGRYIRVVLGVTILTQLLISSSFAQTQTTKWVVRVADGAWVLQGNDDPSKANSDPANYIYVVVPGAAVPDPRLERYDAASPSKRRKATAQEIDAFDADRHGREIATLLLDSASPEGALVWALIEAFDPPATIIKFDAMQDRIVIAAQGRQWDIGQQP